MAIIATKLSEKVLILEPREQMLRRFDFGAWTELRMGMFFSLISTSGVDVDNPNEGVGYTNVADRFFFGVKDDNIALVPGTAGSLFFGMTAPRQTPGGGIGVWADASIGQLGEANATNGSAKTGCYFWGADGTTIVGGVEPADRVPASPLYNDADLTTSYGGFLGLRIVLQDRGLATQMVRMTNNAYFKNDVAAGANNYSLNTLRGVLQTQLATYPLEDFAWNTGVAARPIPDCFFIRNPFYNTRIRLSTIMAIKVA